MPTLQLDETMRIDAPHLSNIASAHRYALAWPTPAVPHPWWNDRFAEQTGPYSTALVGTLFTQSVTGQLPGKTYQTNEYLTHQRVIIDVPNPQSIKNLQEYGTQNRFPANTISHAQWGKMVSSLRAANDICNLQKERKTPD